MDTFSQLAKQHRDAEAALQEERRRRAWRVVNEFCLENEWTEDERQEIILSLGLAEPHTQG